MKDISDKDKLIGILEILREQLVPELKAVDIGATSMTPLAAMVARETLLWRIVELADGVILCINAGNSLGAIILARAAMECAAVQHQLNGTIRNAKNMNAVDVDIATNRLLFGTRIFSTGDSEEDEQLKVKNILGFIEKLDKKFEVTEERYEHLCEYAHPNWLGTAGMFSTGDARIGTIKLGRYVDKSQRKYLEEATSSTARALLIFSADYVAIVDDLPDFFEACDQQQDQVPKT